MVRDTNITDNESGPDSVDESLFNYVEWMTDAGSIIEINFNVKNWPDELLSSFQAPASQVLDEILHNLEKLPVTISLLLCDDHKMQQLNNLHRGLNKPTNILSFAYLNETDNLNSQDLPELLGDIVIAAETVTCEARDLQTPLIDHLTHMFVHGILHLFGYDHVDDAMAEVMEYLEIRYLAKIGIASPYKEAQREINN